MEQKILIVDDEIHIRLLLEQTFEELEDEGVMLLTAEDGEQALEMIRTERPDLVLLDIMMPKLDGFKVCDIVKNKLGMREVFIVMLTAQGQEKDKETGKLVGADLYITKPFDPDKLLDLAVEVLGRKT
jgi:two-component system alkaline phosphatase synthesis response regulator PhoP